jgi:MFS family permease
LLGVLVLVYVLNFLDRQIITILAEDIRADLGISDAQIGFLYGTAFAVFFAVFGIPLGRLADAWSRRSLIALGLAFWSAMTALSGLARGFAELAAARVGVGVGEASASPAAFSLLSDAFPARVRATVIAIYSSGIYIGTGLGLLIGGQIVDRWNAAFAPGAQPFGLAGWQAAYLAVGIPGILLALWVRRLHEPVRGAADGLPPPPREPHPFRAFFVELRAVLPPLTLWHLASSGAGARALAANLLAAAAIGGAALWLAGLTGNAAQWVALGVGVYAAVSWMQTLALRDRPAATLILRCVSLRHLAIGFSLLAFTGYGLGGWTPVFFMREHSEPSGRVGTLVGLTAAFAGLLGVTLGGWLADRLRRRLPEGRLALGMTVALLPIPLALWMLSTPDVRVAYLVNVPLTMLSAMWIGAGASTVQDLVLPRMRSVASAFYILVITFIGFALGPYTIGRLSDLFGDLPAGMRWSLCANALAVLFLARALAHLRRDEVSLRERARAAGEALG